MTDAHRPLRRAAVAEQLAIAQRDAQLWRAIARALADRLRELTSATPATSATSATPTDEGAPHA